MAKGKKKLSAKPAKVKPKLTEASAPEQPLRFKALQAPGLPKGPQGLPGGPIGLPEAITNLEARAERPPIAAEDRALLNDRPIIIQTVVQPVPEPVASPPPPPPPPPTPVEPAVAPPVEPTVVPAKRKPRASRQVRQALRVLALLYPRDKCPEGIPDAVTTKKLVWDIENRMKIEAVNVKNRTELLPAPKWDAVDKARKIFNPPKSEAP